MICFDVIWNLKMGEFIKIHDFEVHRVPGGWIFTRIECEQFSSCFVPYIEKSLC